jgi:hypothetical protein
MIEKIVKGITPKLNLNGSSFIIENTIVKMLPTNAKMQRAISNPNHPLNFVPSLFRVSSGLEIIIIWYSITKM